MSTLLCEPNVSEGRDTARMQRFVEAVRGTRGVELLHESADADHNRMVLAYRGAPSAVTEATVALAERVIAEVDLRHHTGAHPRMGAIDVIPFVPMEGASEQDALGACHRVSSWLATQGVPVFWYERAALRRDRVALPRIRAGGFEGLETKMSQPGWKPDRGPGHPHASAGASVVGVRGALVRFNVNLDAADPGPARQIAARIREACGGLPFVRALGFPLVRRNMSQVSINLTRFSQTPITVVYDTISREAQSLGVQLADTEFIGPVPAAALDGVDPASLSAKLHPGQVIEIP